MMLPVSQTLPGATHNRLDFRQPAHGIWDTGDTGECSVLYSAVHVLYCSLMVHRGHRAWELEKCVTQTTLSQGENNIRLSLLKGIELNQMSVLGMV